MDVALKHNRQAAMAAAALTMVSGGVVCVAWLAGVPEATQLIASSSVVVFNTGLMFIACGGGVLAAVRQRTPLAAALAVLAFALATLTLVEYTWGVDLRIDQVFVHDAFRLSPGRMAPNTATAFALAAASILLLVLSKRVPGSAGAMQTLNALVLAMGAVALIGYALDLPTAFQWAGLTRMAAWTAATLLFLGVALFLAGVDASGARTWDEVPWLAASVGTALVALAALAGHALRHAPDAAQGRLADVVVALGIGVAALFAGTIAQARHLRRQARQLLAAHEALRASADEINDLYDHAPCGYHSLDARGRFVRVNQTEIRWLGYTRDELLQRSFVDVLTPSSRATALEHFARFKREGVLNNLELEFLTKDGRVLPLVVSATAVFDARRNFLHSRSTVFDLTDRKRAEEALRDSEHRLQRLVDGLQAAVVVHAADTSIRYANDAAAAILGLTRDQLLGRMTIDPYWHFVREDATPMPVAEFPVSLVVQRRAELRDYVVGVRVAPEQPVRWMQVNAIPDFGADGVLRQVVVSFMDITERKREAQQLEQLALTDALTSLATRRHFLATAERELAASRRGPQELSLLALDVDHFKSINDRFGHAVGDTVLARVAAKVRGALRESDLAGRLGGEEFAVLLPHAGERAALEVAERIRHALESDEVAIAGGATLRYTASVGVATVGPQDTSLAGVMDRADQAMYEAKRAGRNRVIVAPPLQKIGTGT